MVFPGTTYLHVNTGEKSTCSEITQPRKPVTLVSAPPRCYRNYSWRNATIGSSRAARTAG